MNNLPKVVAQQRHGRASNPQLFRSQVRRPTTKPPCHPGDSMINANKSPKIPYSATVREVEK